MDDMTKWAVVVSAEHYESERLYGTDILTLPPPPPGTSDGATPDPSGSLPAGASKHLAADGSAERAPGATGGLTPGTSAAPAPGTSAAPTPGTSAALAAGDEALLIAATAEPVVFGLARSDADGTLHYTVNLLDAPIPAGNLASTTPGMRRLDEAAFGAISEQLNPRPAPERRTWLVSVDLPIEASSPGEAVRAFWSYVRELGPAELPAFVWPSGDELSMQAFVLGAEANQDPE